MSQMPEIAKRASQAVSMGKPLCSVSTTVIGGRLKTAWNQRVTNLLNQIGVRVGVDSRVWRLVQLRFAQD